MTMQFILGVTCWLATLTVVLGVHDPYTECLNLLNAKEDQLHLIVVQDSTPPSDQSGDYFLCVWKIKNIMDEHGDVNVNNLKDFIKEELNRVADVTPETSKNVSKLFDECDLSVSKVPQETAIKIKNCHAKIMVKVLVPT
ncbi:hypothetical protein FQR65_LT09885 [Abscondita terminalis]|nr:hypothetical protein FQR65_LT09885 [Abscondita terminalis]